jgi:hypothetical protein
MKDNYNSKEIIALDDFEHVMARPTMYVGSINISEEKVPLVRNNTLVFDTKPLSVGFYKLMNEILDNAFDEAKRQKGKMPRIEIHFSTKDNSVKVIDTGGGFINASKTNEKTGVSNVESAFTRLRAGSNFYNDNSEETLIGTNGVGAALVNMLSEKFHVKTVNDTETYEQEWRKFQSMPHIIGEKTNKDHTGTTVTFVPRKDKFKGCVWDKEYVHTLMIFKKMLLAKDPVVKNCKFICKFDGQEIDLDIAFTPEDAIVIDTKIGQVIVWESYANSASVSFINGALCTGIHQRIIGDHINTIFMKTLLRIYKPLFSITKTLDGFSSTVANCSSMSLMKLYSKILLFIDCVGVPILVMRVSYISDVPEPIENTVPGFGNSKSSHRGESLNTL